MNESTDDCGLARLAEFAAGLDVDALPAAVTAQAKACLLYGLMVGAASTRARAPHIAALAMDAECDAEPGSPQATRLIDGKRLLAGQAAFANAALLHARIQEDAHPTGHVGVVVVPAALAVAERVRASGPALLAGIVAGYEVALRIGRDHAADTSSRGFRTTPLYGVLGAAAASARLMELSPQQMQNALALAANNACGLREFVNAGTGEYTLHASFAARNGIACALCARVGAVAAATTLDGPAGFHASYGLQGKDYGSRLSQDLGEHFELLRVTYKPYPTCQFHRGVVEGVLALRERAGKRELASMRIRMNPFEADFIGVRYAGPFRTFSQTFMSAPFCAAVAWEHGELTYDLLHAFGDERVAAGIARVEVISDAGVPRYQPRIELQFVDGTSTAWSESAGADAFALTWEAAIGMAGMLAREAGVAQPAVDALIAAVARLDQAGGDVGALIDAARAAIRSSQSR